MDDEIIPLMRTLHRHGVTHFVVSDQLYGRLAKNADGGIGGDSPALNGGEYLLFRRRRILRQADLAHLPFKVTAAGLE